MVVVIRTRGLRGHGLLGHPQRLLGPGMRVHPRKEAVADALVLARRLHAVDLLFGRQVVAADQHRQGREQLVVADERVRAGGGGRAGCRGVGRGRGGAREVFVGQERAGARVGVGVGEERGAVGPRGEGARGVAARGHGEGGLAWADVEERVVGGRGRRRWRQRGGRGGERRGSTAEAVAVPHVCVEKCVEVCFGYQKCPGELAQLYMRRHGG